MRVAPRKARPFVPGDERSFSCPRATRRDRRHRLGGEPTTDDHHRSAQPDRSQTPRRRAPTRSSCGRPATPTSRRRSARSCASTTAVRPTCSSPSRAASASAGTASSASVRAGSWRSVTAWPPSRPGRSPCRVYAPDLPTVAEVAPDPLAAHPRVRAPPSRPTGRGDAPVHRWRRGRAGLRRRVDLRADRPAPDGGSGRRPGRGLHRDGPRPRLRPPDPHDERDRQPPHRGARTSRVATRSPSGRSSRRSSGPPVPSAAELAGAVATGRLAGGRLGTGGRRGRP